MRLMITCPHTKKKLQRKMILNHLGAAWEQGSGEWGGEGGHPFAVTYKASLRHLVTD